MQKKSQAAWDGKPAGSNRAAKGPALSGDKFQESKSSGPQMVQAIQLF